MEEIDETEILFWDEEEAKDRGQRRRVPKNRTLQLGSVVPLLFRTYSYTFS